jgi:hypothetical protein
MGGVIVPDVLVMKALARLTEYFRTVQRRLTVSDVMSLSEEVAGSYVGNNTISFHTPPIIQYS